MKIAHLCKVIALFFLLTAASPAFSASNTEPIHENNEARAQVLERRLAEIKAIDKAALSKEEKKALRREVKEIKKSLAAVSGGVYLSVGAILLIALLLILLL